jgi:hypothetical protein
VLGAEGGDNDEVDVRAPPEELALDDSAQSDFTELAGVERPEEPDHRPLSGTVHVMPPWLRAGLTSQEWLRERAHRPVRIEDTTHHKTLET